MTHILVDATVLCVGFLIFGLVQLITTRKLTRCMDTIVHMNAQMANKLLNL